MCVSFSSIAPWHCPRVQPGCLGCKYADAMATGRIDMKLTDQKLVNIPRTHGLYGAVRVRDVKDLNDQL